jgi:hypothetical protein
MNEQTVRKTYKYKLNPTSEQERALEFVLRRCRDSTTPVLWSAATHGRSAG